MSSTVAVAVQVETFPLLSVTVNVTVLDPTFEQSKLFGETASEAMPQASDEPLSMSAAVIEPFPLLSNWTVTFWQTATGATLSSTVTVAVQVEALPPTSVTVSVTVFAPTLEQEKLFGETASEAIPQASDEPLSMSEAVIEPLPVLSNCTVTFWHTTAGATVSSIVTFAVQVETLPLLSVTVSVAVLDPAFAQLKVEGETDKEAMPQASFEPLSMSDAAMVALPEEFN